MLNTNPNQVTAEQMEANNYRVGTKIVSMQSLVIPVEEHMYQFNESLTGGPFAGYIGSTVDTWLTRFETFNPSADWRAWPFANVITEFYAPYRGIVDGTDDEVANAFASLLRVAVLNRVTDSYGPMPYSDALTNESITVKYDSQEEVYMQMFAELDAAIEAFGNNTGLDATAWSNYDRVYYGDISKWVKYANSQAYIDDYMRSLAELKQDGNKIILQEYHAADVLIIDDIQNIIGKQSTIEQFFQLVDEFLRLNKKIAIASDRAPKELAMDERLTSRFNSGMLCLVSEPGFETKYAILKHYYETTILGQSAADYANVDADLLQSLQIEHGKLTDEQLRYMAEISGNNIRELESFCERCSHDAREKELSGAELTGDDIQEIANQYFDTAQKVIRVNTVQAVVEEFYQVAHKDLIGRKRTSNIASARHMAIYLTYELCSLSLNAIGAAFGGRDHATVINSIKVIEKRMGEDTQVSDDCQRLRTKIQLRS